MKKFRKSLLVFLLIVSFNALPLLAFAQEDFDNNDSLNNQYGGSSGTSTGVASNNSSNPVKGCVLDDNPKIQNLFDYISCIINRSVIPLIFTLALAFFVYGVVQYMLSNADEHKRETGKQYMVWGIVALTVMVSVWGLVNLLGNTFGLDTGFLPKVSPE